jgi:hypothetical protein
VTVVIGAPWANRWNGIDASARALPASNPADHQHAE